MKFKYIKENETNLVEELVPDYCLKQAQLLIALEDKENICGLAVLMQKDIEWALTWIYVEDDKRGMGLGDMLLDEAIRCASKKGGQFFTVTFDKNGDACDVLLVMLARRGFMLDYERVNTIMVTREQAKKAIFMTDEKYLNISYQGHSKTKVYPFYKVKAAELSTFLKKYEEKGSYIVSRAAFNLADSRLSKALFHEGNMVGLLLIEKTNYPGMYTVPVCFVSSKYHTGFVELIKSLADEMLHQTEDFERLSFNCMDDTVQKLGEHIFPEHDMYWDDLVTAQIWLQ